MLPGLACTAPTHCALRRARSTCTLTTTSPPPSSSSPSPPSATSISPPPHPQLLPHYELWPFPLATATPWRDRRHQVMPTPIKQRWAAQRSHRGVLRCRRPPSGGASRAAQYGRIRVTAVVRAVGSSRGAGRGHATTTGAAEGRACSTEFC